MNRKNRQGVGIDFATGEIWVRTWRWRLPDSRHARIWLGFALIFGGMLGFLPVLGFWMIPLGLLVLSQDIPAVRRWRRRLLVKWGKKKKAKRGSEG